ncbi:hypothetical protein K502DRAFT_289308 [Neoconidiobolus thromboides FSU 785]|nr:hypothetical protein K502DRAFT_289308 [Neoconidiobolus thromboides FSU 785]
MKTFDSLPALAPVFPAKAEDIVIINEPVSFYDVLKDKIINSKRQITLASLYFGPEEKEIINLLRESLAANKDLKLKILLDCLRGTRKTKTGSSIEVLSPLQDEFPDRVELHFYHTPDLTGWSKKLIPNRFNETIGLMHIKAYLFDDDVILSGYNFYANLSKDYFSNRQDRYYLFKNNLPLLSYFQMLIDTLSEISYKAKPNNDEKMPYLLKMENFPDPVYESSNDTVIVPIIQMAPLNIFQDQTVTLSLLRAIDNSGRFQNEKYSTAITSGYFNFNQLYQERILSTSALFRIITASPEANGFFNSKGVSKFIPDAYTLIEKEFLFKVKGKHREKTIKVEEYHRDKWTYHAKGLWMYKPNESIPFLTMIGSPNYGSRSLERDLEAQAIIVTSNVKLRTAMQKELDNIEDYVNPISLDDLETQNREPRLFAKVATPIIKSML